MDSDDSGLCLPDPSGGSAGAVPNDEESRRDVGHGYGGPRHLGLQPVGRFGRCEDDPLLYREERVEVDAFVNSTLINT